MGLMLTEPVAKFFRVKHSFNADDDSESLIKAADAVLKDKTEFINRCIQAAGPTVIRTINEERNKAVALYLREESPPVKRKAG